MILVTAGEFQLHTTDLILRDFSSNGTLINGVLLKKGPQSAFAEISLCDGGTLRFGGRLSDCEYRVRIVLPALPFATKKGTEISSAASASRETMLGETKVPPCSAEHSMGPATATSVSPPAAQGRIQSKVAAPSADCTSGGDSHAPLPPSALPLAPSRILDRFELAQDSAQARPLDAPKPSALIPANDPIRHIFQGVLATASGMGRGGRRQLRRLLALGGGRLSPHLTAATTHLLIPPPDATAAAAAAACAGAKGRAAAAHGVAVVSARWVSRSAAAGVRLPESLFPIDGGSTKPSGARPTGPTTEDAESRPVQEHRIHTAMPLAVPPRAAEAAEDGEPEFSALSPDSLLRTRARAAQPTASAIATSQAPQDHPRAPPAVQAPLHSVALAAMAAPAQEAAVAAAAAAAQVALGLEDELSCPICADLLVAPRNAPCGHAFCAACIARWLAVSPSCPICKARLPSLSGPNAVCGGGDGGAVAAHGLARSVALEGAVRRLVAGRGPAAISAYAERAAAHAEELQLAEAKAKIAVTEASPSAAPESDLQPGEEEEGGEEEEEEEGREEEEESSEALSISDDESDPDFRPGAPPGLELESASESESESESESDSSELATDSEPELESGPSGHARGGASRNRRHPATAATKAAAASASMRTGRQRRRVPSSSSASHESASTRSNSPLSDDGRRDSPPRKRPRGGVGGAGVGVPGSRRAPAQRRAAPRHNASGRGAPAAARAVLAANIAARVSAAAGGSDDDDVWFTCGADRAAVGDGGRGGGAASAAAPRTTLAAWGSARRA